MRVALAQLPVYAGDLRGNAARIVSASHEAARDGADVVLTPEMVLSGYPIDDLVADPDFLDAVHDTLEELSTSLPPHLLVAVGTPLGRDRLPDQYPLSNAIDAETRAVVNALALIRGGAIEGYVVKRLLPTYGVFDDSRWFAAASTPSPLVDVAGIKVGFAICEDAWSGESVDDLVDAGAEAIFVSNASPFALGKSQARMSLIGEHARRRGVPIAYVNLTGGQDEVVYDGASFVCARDGTVTYTSPSFHPSTETVPWEECTVSGMPTAFTPDDPLADTYAALSTGLHDYVTRAGVDGVIVGLSGGLDSALAATLAVDALGPERVHGVALPGPFSSQHALDDARQLAANLRIRFDVIPINKTYEMERSLLGERLSGAGARVADENIQARLRALHLMTLANAHNLIVLNTGNKSEASVGYFTLGGDSSGGFAILKDVLKTHAYALAEWRNHQTTSNYPVSPIPQSTLTKPPSAELAPNQCDSDSLPPYPILDTILRLHLEDRAPRSEITSCLAASFPDEITNAEETVNHVLQLVARAEHKRRQIAPGVKVSACAYGRDRRFPIISGFPDR